jgi:hypothetical protein
MGRSPEPRFFMRICSLLLGKREKGGHIASNQQDDRQFTIQDVTLDIYPCRTHNTANPAGKNIYRPKAITIVTTK